jgi:NAD(P)-dependent dehydrogenase (short-subunit alcohol dehydrogenase family)
VLEIDLAGRVAAVSGAASGIGRAVAQRLAAAGARVAVVDVDEAGALATATAIGDAGGAAETHVVDVRTRGAIDALARQLLHDHGHVDILVNNVGHYLRATPVLDATDEHWAALHDVNVLHVFRCCRAFVPSMIEHGGGAVVNVTSVEGLRGYPPDAVYAAYKAAVTHFTRAFALEVAGRGVRVNAIAPDVTQTAQVDYETIVPEAMRDRWPRWVPVGRVGAPEDSADVVLFLVSDLARFVTGHVIPTDGGTLAAGGWFKTATGRWANRPRDA